MNELESNGNSKTNAEMKRLLLEGGREALTRLFIEEMDLSESTARTYRASWTDYRSWCDAQGRDSLPTDPYVLAQYLEARSGLALGTLRNRLSAIGAVHRQVGLDNPTEAAEVKEVASALSQQKNSGGGSRSPAEKLETGPYSPSDILKGGPELLREYLDGVFTQQENGQEGGGQEGKPEDVEQKRGQACSLWQDSVIEKVEVSPGRMTPEQKKLIPEPEFDLAAMRDRTCLLLMTEAKCTRAELARLDLIDVFVEETEQSLSKEEELEERLSSGLTEDQSSLPTKREVWVGVRQANGMPDRALRLPKEDNLRLCPARAITAWVVGAGLSGGALLRPFGSHGSLKERRIGSSSVNLLTRKAAENAGLDPNEWTPSRLLEEGSAF